MSSTLLYLAIVAVWAVVLVPMWLRRDTDAVRLSRLLARKAGPMDDGYADDDGDLHTAAGDPDEAGSVDRAAGGHLPDAPGIAPGESPYGHAAGDVDPAEARMARRRRHGRRAAVIARRRRRTFGLTLLLIGISVVAATGLAPWWVTLPPSGLLAGHLALLRVAVGVDAARRQAARAERARIMAERRLAEQEAREREEAARAEIIDLAERARARDVFDQYAAAERFADADGRGHADDERRAVGD